jgi:hypothetical protein
MNRNQRTNDYVRSVRTAIGAAIIIFLAILVSGCVTMAEAHSHSAAFRGMLLTIVGATPFVWYLLTIRSRLKKRRQSNWSGKVEKIGP